MTLFELLTAVNYLVVLPAVVGLYNFQRYNSGFKALTLLFCAGFVAEVVATYTAITFGNNMPVFYVYTIIEVGLMTYFIFRVSPGKYIFPTFPLVITAITLTEMSVNMLAFPSISRAIMCVGFILLLVYVVWKVAMGMEINRWKYVMVGVMLVYYCAALSYFAFARFLTGEPLYFMAIMHVVINAMANILSSIVLWKYTTSSSLA